MSNRARTLKTVTVALLAGLSLTACSVDVNTRVEAQETGLPAYPGARLVRDHDGAESAKVNINTSWFGVNVVAAKYHTDDRPAAVVDFYRQAMAASGATVECRGNIDFKGRRGHRTAVCHADASSDEVQLVAGVETDQRIVAVKPRGTGAEFAVVHVRTR